MLKKNIKKIVLSLVIGVSFFIPSLSQAASVPSVSIHYTTIQRITQTTAYGSGQIDSDGGLPVTVSGIVWGTTLNPTLPAFSKTTDGLLTSDYWTSQMIGLTCNTTYHVRAYATNSVGAGYSGDLSFTTSACASITVPSVSYLSTSNITQISAIGSAQINSNGGSTVKTSGLVWGINPNPIISISTITYDGWAEGGPWQSKMDKGLSCNTIYYVRAYATNDIGTGYSGDFNFTTSACTSATVPTINTLVAFSNISQTTAVGGGTTISDGGSPVTVSGLLWSTNLNPTLPISTKTTDGKIYGWPNGTPWSGTITGLTCNTTYHARAYATNSVGTGYGLSITFTTSACATSTIPSLNTPTITALTSTSATLGANVVSLGTPASISVRGICWGTTPNPTINCIAEGGTTIGVFTKNFTGFTPGTQYYYRGYATNASGIGYSADGTFTTQFSLPTVTTSSFVLNVVPTLDYAGSGNVTSDGGSPVTVSGLVWSTNLNPTLPISTKTTDGYNANWAVGGPWSSTITNLTCNTTYHVRAYATNSMGTGYGKDVSFTTLTCGLNSLPTLNTPTATSITSTTATLGANVTSFGPPGASISSRGICWGVIPNPTINCVSEGGTTTGTFTKDFTGFTPGTQYYYRGYAINASGTGYSADGNFTTTIVSTIPSVSTHSISPIPLTMSAMGGGTVTTDGGSPVTVSGLVWSTNLNPTLPISTKTTDGYNANWAVGGPWSSTITNLTCNTTYHVRAYATNSVGTGYGADVSFTFTSALCNTTNTDWAILADGATNVAFKTATLNGSVWAAGVDLSSYDDPVFKYSTKESTSCAGLQGAIEKIGTYTTPTQFSKPFLANITDLSQMVPYYYCVYMENKDDSSLNKYSEVESFKTGEFITNPATGIGLYSATFNGKTTPDIISSSFSEYSAFFKYSISPDLGCKDFVNKVDAISIHSSDYKSSILVNSFNGLSSDTTYYYCAYLKNNDDQSLDLFGNIQAFKTSSIVGDITTISATYLPSIPATLLAGKFKFADSTLNKEDIAPYLYFNYSTSPDLACGDLENQQFRYYAGSEDFGTYLQNLIPGKTYYYCALYKNGSVVKPGEVKLFVANDVSVSDKLLTIATADCSASGTDFTLNGAFLNNLKKPFTTYFQYKAGDADFTNGGKKTTEFQRTENITTSGTFNDTPSPTLNANTNYFYQAVGFFNDTPSSLSYGNIMNCDTTPGGGVPDGNYPGKISFDNIDADPVTFTITELTPDTDYIFFTGDTDTSAQIIGTNGTVIDGGDVVYEQISFTTDKNGSYTFSRQLTPGVTYNFSVKAYDTGKNEFSRKVAASTPIKTSSKPPSPAPESPKTTSVNLVPCGTERWAAGTYLIHDSKDLKDPKSYTGDKQTGGKPNIDVSGQVKESNMCTFYNILDLINNFVNFTFKNLVVPIGAIAFAYAGFLLVSSGGETSKREKAKKIFWAVVWGLVICAAAWLIIHVVLFITGFTGNAFGL